MNESIDAKNRIIDKKKQTHLMKGSVGLRMQSENQKLLNLSKDMNQYQSLNVTMNTSMSKGSQQFPNSTAKEAFS